MLDLGMREQQRSYSSWTEEEEDPECMVGTEIFRVETLLRFRKKIYLGSLVISPKGMQKTANRSLETDLKVRQCNGGRIIWEQGKTVGFQAIAGTWCH